MEALGRICVFLKAPVPGAVKTRLVPAVGRVGAAVLAKAFFEDSWHALARVAWARPVVALAGAFAVSPGAEVWPQGEGDLGDRMERILQRALSDAPFALALGADTPGLPARLVEAARDHLARADAVLGPSPDGGFYLLGLRRCPPGLLAGLPWGVLKTREYVVERLRGAGMAPALLEEWSDLDRPEDLRRFARTDLDAPATRCALLRHPPAPPLIDVVVPALDEAGAIAQVVRGLLRPRVRSVVVVDNGSRDGTGSLAAAAGARVVLEPRRGYGAACLAGVRSLPADSEIIVFCDGDASDDPSLLPRLVRPIEEDEADLVIGSRTRGRCEPGALTPQQRLGNAIACRWLTMRYGQPTTDLGPFRAIRTSALIRLRMADRDYGWTVEMQIKAARQGLRYAEIPVPYRRRIGRSKISRTIRGTLGCFTKIFGLLLRHDLLRGRAR